MQFCRVHYLAGHLGTTFSHEFKFLECCLQLLYCSSSHSNISIILVIDCFHISIDCFICFKVLQCVCMIWTTTEAAVTVAIMTIAVCPRKVFLLCCSRIPMTAAAAAVRSPDSLTLLFQLLLLLLFLCDPQSLLLLLR